MKNWKEFLPESECLILDAGGDGASAMEAAKMGHRVFILNESQEAVNSAGAKIREAGLSNKIIPAQGELEDIKFPDDTFDFVLGESNSPLSKKAAGELFRVAKKGAPIVIGLKKYDK